MQNKIKPNKKKAIFLAKKQLPELVCDAVNLEGINYTIPEVQTLLDGVTVGGHKLSDQTITLNQAKAWDYLFRSIENSSFNLEARYAKSLHHIAAYEEALVWGQFRDGMVTIAGTEYTPPEANQLENIWINMIKASENFTDIYTQSIYIFLQMARNQFFYDVNKRMGRFIMNGLLLSNGYPVINLPAKHQAEFNRLMLEFYSSNNPEPMTKFMLSLLDKRIINIMNE